VVGSVVGLTLIVLGIFLWYRNTHRTKAAQKAEQRVPLAYQKSELDSTTKATSEEHELHPNRLQHELHPYSLSELQGSYSGTELPGKSRHATNRAYEMDS
jgi:hypothetical protein